MPEEKNEALWRIAQKRAQFRKSLFSYIIICAFQWGVWWFTTGNTPGYGGYPWPVWVMLGWGIGIAFQYFQAYTGDKQTLTEQEYEKLKRERGL